MIYDHVLFSFFFQLQCDWNGYNIFVGKTSSNSVNMNVWVFKAPRVCAMRQLDLFYCICKAEAVTGVEPIGAVGFFYIPIPFLQVCTSTLLP